MTDLPSSILVRCRFPGNGHETLICKKLLRTVPGSRDVYEASWKDQVVIAKVFSHRFSAKRHMKREWRGLKILQRHRLAAPEPLFCGRGEDGKWVVVETKVPGALTALGAYNQTADQDEKLSILLSVCHELAGQHENGVLQKDLHLDNFLMDERKVYTLDPGKMGFYPRPVPRKQCISHLAMLACYLQDDDDRSVQSLYEEYVSLRAWKGNRKERERFRVERDFQRNRIARHGLKKTLRSGKRYLKMESKEFLAVLDRDFFAGTEPLAFINKIDNLMAEGDVIKDGNTCFVSRLCWNGLHVVAKRYNPKGLGYALRHSFMHSRAKRNWLYSHRLSALHVVTPQPLAFIEKRRGPLVYESYFCTRYVEGENLSDLLTSGVLSTDRQQAIVSQVCAMLQRLWKYRISHGDLKHSNILINTNGPVLTDLDAARAHKGKWLFKHRLIKDHRRFELPFKKLGMDLNLK